MREHFKDVLTGKENINLACTTKSSLVAIWKFINLNLRNTILCSSCLHWHTMEAIFLSLLRTIDIETISVFCGYLYCQNVAEVLNWLNQWKNDNSSFVMHSAHGAQTVIITESSQNTLKSSKFRADYRSNFSFSFGLIFRENFVIKVTASKRSP